MSINEIALRKEFEELKSTALEMAGDLDDDIDIENASYKEIYQYVRENEERYSKWLYLNVK